ncbi:hypothetical protein GGS20DRAFT_556306 [Poronia punctata]|nr:hypothetical protein GGS20DRAFT_556306 [Poronia punctata]
MWKIELVLILLASWRGGKKLGSMTGSEELPHSQTKARNYRVSLCSSGRDLALDHSCRQIQSAQEIQDAECVSYLPDQKHDEGVGFKTCKYVRSPAFPPPTNVHVGNFRSRIVGMYYEALIHICMYLIYVSWRLRKVCICVGPCRTT